MRKNKEQMKTYLQKIRQSKTEACLSDMKTKKFIPIERDNSHNYDNSMSTYSRSYQMEQRCPRNNYDYGNFSQPSIYESQNYPIIQQNPYQYNYSQVNSFQKPYPSANINGSRKFSICQYPQQSQYPVQHSQYQPYHRNSQIMGQNMPQMNNNQVDLYQQDQESNRKNFEQLKEKKMKKLLTGLNCQIQSVNAQYPVREDLSALQIELMQKIMKIKPKKIQKWDFLDNL